MYRIHITQIMIGFLLSLSEEAKVVITMGRNKLLLWIKIICNNSFLSILNYIEEHIFILLKFSLHIKRKVKNMECNVD